uniref:Uncharacterized protein n=1 Tax=Anguilla anguilla TaxID=7936 RepID=A0A0E9WLB4_ANGAN
MKISTESTTFRGKYLNNTTYRITLRPYDTCYRLQAQKVTTHSTAISSCSD